MLLIQLNWQYILLQNDLFVHGFTSCSEYD